MQLGNLLKNLFFLLLFLQIAPTFIKNIKDQYSSFLSSRSKVAVLTIENNITDASTYIKQLRQFFKREDIKALLLKINSPGGFAGSSQAIFQEILTLKHTHNKPVVTYVENICASGAYYVACSADTLIATPSAMLGSIGVYIQHPQLHEFMEQWHIKYNVISSGSYKTAGSPFLPATPEHRQMLQAVTNDTHQQFIKDVLAQRTKLSSKKVKEWGEGQVFTGNQALTYGLIDGTGSLQKVEQELKAKMGTQEEIEWVKAPTASFSWQKFFFQGPKFDTTTFLTHLLGSSSHGQATPALQ